MIIEFALQKSRKRSYPTKKLKALSVTRACLFLGITRQALYKRCISQMKRQANEQCVLDFVTTELIKHPRIGARKLKYLMASQQLYIGRDHLFTLLAFHHLLVSPKRTYHKTTNSHHHFRCHPNLVKDNLTLSKPEQLWVADITYLPTLLGNTYLSLVTNAYSKKFVGYHVDDNMKASSVKQAFKQVLREREKAISP